MVTHGLSEETDLGGFGADGKREFRFTPDLEETESGTLRI